MKSIRKIAGKVMALAVAITTSVALLSPYDGNAQSGTGTTLSGGGGCGFVQELVTCTSSTTIKYNSQGSISTQWSTAFGASYPAISINGQYNSSNAYVFQNASEIKVNATYAMKCMNRGYGIKECTSEACIGQAQPVAQKCPGARCR